MDDWAEYSALKRVNWSRLKLVHDSPLMCKWRQDHPQKDKSAWLVGRALNTAILELRDEPGLFDDRYIIKPRGMKLNTKAGKAWLEENADGRDIITAEQHDMIGYVTDHLSNHKAAMDLLSGTRREEIIKWTINGVEAKGRVDLISSLVLGDLKSANSFKRFFVDAARYLYHGQLAFYRDGAVKVGACSETVKVKILVVQTTEPYDIGVLPLPAEVLEAGRRLYLRLLEKFVTCTQSDYWPGRFPAETPLDLPGWAPGMNEPNESNKETW